MWCCVIGWLECDILRQYGGLICKGQNFHGETWRSLHEHFDPRRQDHNTVSEQWAPVTQWRVTISQTSTALLQKHKSSHSNTPVTVKRKWKGLEECCVVREVGLYQASPDMNQGNLHGKHCVATWRLVDFSRDWRCYAEFTFWIQRQMIMNCRLDQMVRSEDVDVQSELEGLEPVPDSDQLVCC